MIIINKIEILMKINQKFEIKMKINNKWSLLTLRKKIHLLSYKINYIIKKIIK